MIPFLISIIILNISISDSNGNTGKAGQMEYGHAWYRTVVVPVVLLVE